MSAGAAACKKAEGIVDILPRMVRLSASLAGFRTSVVDVQVPKQEASVHFELLPEQGLPKQVVASGSTSLVVFHPKLTGDSLAPEWNRQISERLAQGLKTNESYSEVVLVDANDWKFQQSEGVTECDGEADCYAAICHSLKARYGLVSFLLDVGNQCSLTSTLLDIEENKIIGVARIKTNCQLPDLLEGVDSILNQLKKPGNV